MIYTDKNKLLQKKEENKILLGSTPNNVINIVNILTISFLSRFSKWKNLQNAETVTLFILYFNSSIKYICHVSTEYFNSMIYQATVMLQKGQFALGLQTYLLTVYFSHFYVIFLQTCTTENYNFPTTQVHRS